MLVIIGFGNDLRGEDAFGLDVIAQLQKHGFENTKFISTFQLTPELALELQDAKKIVFIDAAYSLENNYKLACSLEEINQNNLSHHISIKTILEILKTLYNKNPKYEVYSMLTNSFENISNKEKYKESINKTTEFILNS